MAKKGRPKLWENCSKEEQAEVEEIEKSYLLLREDYERGSLTKRQYDNKRTKLLKKLDEVEKKYEL